MLPCAVFCFAPAAPAAEGAIAFVPLAFALAIDPFTVPAEGVETMLVGGSTNEWGHRSHW